MTQAITRERVDTAIMQAQGINELVRGLIVSYPANSQSYPNTIGAAYHISRVLEELYILRSELG